MAAYPEWYRRLYLKWVVTQGASILCLVAASMLLLTGMTRLEEPEFMWPWAWAYGQQMVLFYLLHWRLQGRCEPIDPVRTDRLVAVIKFRQSRYDPEF